MIDISALRPSRLHETPLGALFVPVVANGSHFLAGRVGPMINVLVVLDGEQPFTIGETLTWSRAPGVVVDGGRFQVDTASGVSAGSFHDIPVGALILCEPGPVLVGKSQNGSRAVHLGASLATASTESLSVAFTKWQYVSGPSEATLVHFAHQG